VFVNSLWSVLSNSVCFGLFFYSLQTINSVHSFSLKCFSLVAPDRSSFLQIKTASEELTLPTMLYGCLTGPNYHAATMQARTSYECLSVCLSVHLSNACIVTKTKAHSVRVRVKISYSQASPCVSTSNGYTHGYEQS